MNKLKYKNIKSFYYLRHVLAALVPRIFYRLRLKSELKKIKHYDKKYIFSRLNYYHKKEDGFKNNILFIKSRNVRKLLAEISFKNYHDIPKNIIAVTGTNGKSSIVDFYYQILDLNKKKVASIGTLGVKSKNLKMNLLNTKYEFSLKIQIEYISERYGTGRSVGSVGGRLVFRRTIFQKNRIRDFFEKCLKRDGTGRRSVRNGSVGSAIL